MDTTLNKYATAKSKGAPLGATILAEEKVEPHLSIVLAEREIEYVRWWFNHQTGGFFWGQYFRKDASGGEEAAKARAAYAFRSTVKERKII